MKIYDFEGFPNPARVRMALAEKQLTHQVEFVSVNVPEGEHHSPEFIKLNPSRTVPVLELNDGTTIAECTAITEYIDHAYQSGVNLTGTTPRQRALIHMMNRRAEANVLDAIGAYFHHATSGLGPDLETYQNTDWGRAQRDRAIQGMGYFNEVLAKSEFVAGESFSMADITLYAGLTFADFVEVDVPADCNHLLAWRERISKRPALAA